MHNYKIIAIGEVTIDIFLSLDNENKKIRLDEKTSELCISYGEKIDVNSSLFSIGGNAANVSVGLTRLGIRTAFFAETGDDEFSLKILNSLAKEGLDRSFVRQVKNQATSMSFSITYKGDRTLFVEHVKREHLFNYSDINAEYMYLTSLGQNWKDAYEKAYLYSFENNCKLIFNPGTVQLREEGDVLKKALEKTEIVFLNKEEAEQLVFNKENKDKKGEEYMRNLMTKVQLLGPNIVVVTDGGNGSFAQDKRGIYYEEKAYPTKIIEKTGAGDGYSAGFLGGIIHGVDIQTAMQWGAINAASVVTMVGSQSGLLTKSQMDSKVEKYE